MDCKRIIAVIRPSSLSPDQESGLDYMDCYRIVALIRPIAASLNCEPHVINMDCIHTEFELYGLYYVRAFVVMLS